MAEFALGLTKTAVKETVSRVKSAIEEEAKLRVHVQDELVFITGEFEMMQSFLSTSGTGERASRHRVVRTWVRQLRDLAFDVENCVEFIIHLDKPSRWDCVHRLTSSVGVCMGRPPLPLDLAVAEIKRLKARVEDVCQRNTRYNLIGDDNSPADAHHQLTLSTGSSKGVTRALQVLLDVWKEAGKLGGHTAVDLKKLIDSHVSELQVISLWRAGGDAPPNNYVLLLKQAYDDPEICGRFKNRAWVKLSTLHPFNPVEFVNNLLTQFTSRHHHLKGDQHNHANANSTISELLLQLSQLSYLVVIEQELTTVADWDAIRMYLPDGNNGSRVVVSTNSLGIALVCTGDPYQVSQLKRFSHDQGLYAFFPKGCGHRSGMGEFIWQLRHCGVISLFGGSSDDRSQFVHELGEEDNTTINKLTELDKSRVLDAVKFEHCYWYNTTETVDKKFKLAHLARSLVYRSYPKDEQISVSEDLERMGEQDIIERCRKLLTEHDYLIFIKDLESSTDWDLIKRQLLCESTKGRIVVITTEDNQGATTRCVDHDEYRALNLRGVMKGFDEQYHKERGNIKEEGKYELDELVFFFEKGIRRRSLHRLMHMTLDEPFGNEDEVRDTMDHVVGIIKENDGTFSVWGISGLGKTAMARKMYNELINSYRMHGRVDVPYPFNLTELCRRLLLDFYSVDVDARESAAIGMMEGQDPIQWCRKILLEDRCLIIIDDLRSKQDWDMVKATLLSQPINGTFIVITREEGIAAHCTDSKDRIINVRGLKDDAALDLFNKIAWEGQQLSGLHPEAQIISKLLVPKCGGLPDVIDAIGKSVRAKEFQIRRFWLADINSDFIGRLEDFVDFPSLKGLFSWMQSYFNACSDELKPCIFYMSVFPPDQSIRWSRLLRRWIAEGYSSSAGGTAGENGNKLLSELKKLSILYQQQQTPTISSYKVNGFFYEYIKSRPMEDNLVFSLEGSPSPSSRLTGQHLTISSSWDRDKAVFNSIDLSRLRSLTVFGPWRSFLTSKKMRVLRVLDLEGTSTSDVTSVTDDDLEQIGKLLHRLKFLSLRGCQQITRLPDSLDDMRQLQTLDVRYTSIVELPSAIITKLHKLQYIRAGTSNDTSLLLQQTKTSTPPQTPPQEQNHRGSIPLVGARTAASAVQEASTKTTAGCRRREHDLVESCRSSWWQFKNQLNLRSRRRLAANGGGVEVSLAAAKGIGRLTDMHTLGVVNVACLKGGFLFLKELKKLTHLRKLGLSGINRKNWSQLCDAISGNLHHLESLSLQLMLLEKEGGRFEFACFDDMPNPPKTINRIKVLYTSTGGRDAGVARISPGWFNKLPNLHWIPHEITISSQEDIRQYVAAPGTSLINRLLIKPIEEHLIFGRPSQDEFGDALIPLRSLRIECSSTLPHSKVTFGDLDFYLISEISIHCCCSSSSSAGTSATGSLPSCNLQIAGLAKLHELEKVTVTGTYREDIKRDLREQIDNHPRGLVLE